MTTAAATLHYLPTAPKSHRYQVLVDGRVIGYVERVHSGPGRIGWRTYAQDGHGLTAPRATRAAAGAVVLADWQAPKPSTRAITPEITVTEQHAERLFLLDVQGLPQVAVEEDLLFVTGAELIYRRLPDRSWRWRQVTLTGAIGADAGRREFHPFIEGGLINAPGWVRLLVERFRP